ncbi:translocator protein, LysE family [Lysobacter enzymogenes]|uniref:Translocator protein, LysE family n=1 Tax=Lysobacter enzymogenes TaxID=69 RepID=A0A0S2DBY8_LYSEN|nr:LysE family translocator [Lysobacter enzymogenes]ALN56001.1 translocator protein, LysE family [Lysobacter enzymogenes]QCW24944.1 LysE family translocator [Lysobacter enzymogenes]
MDPQTLAAFFATALFLAVVPGPDNVFVLTQSALRGKRAGLWVVLGLCSGLLVHTAAVALGVAALFERSPLAFDLLKYAGAAYLLYLAWQSLRAPAMAIDAGAGARGNAGRLYLRGIVMNVSNPKVSIFFLAFLPQFVDKQAGSVTLQMLALGATFILATALVFGALALSAGAVGQRFARSQRAQRWMNRAAAAVFAGLAAKLATAQR